MAVLYEVKALVMTLFDEGLLSLGVGLLLLAMLLREVLLILLGILVRRVIVARSLGLRESGGGHKEGCSEKEETDASRFHGLTSESGLAEWYTQNFSFAFLSTQVHVALSEAGHLMLRQQEGIVWAVQGLRWSQGDLDFVDVTGERNRSGRVAACEEGKRLIHSACS